eukprot:2561414-Amphidinium_carterae.2
MMFSSSTFCFQWGEGRTSAPFNTDQAPNSTQGEPRGRAHRSATWPLPRPRHYVTVRLGY